MYWREDEEGDVEYHPPQDVFDLLFRIRGESLDIDHAWPLARALQEILPAAVCQRIGVHGVRLPESGNGWYRPEDTAEALVHLSRRTRMVLMG